ncbi:MAG: PilZ domain-containing protein [Bdellovibrionota bacterium]
MSRTHYFLAPVRVYDRNTLTLTTPRALVSLTGVYRLFEESNATYRAFLEAKIFTVEVDGLAMEGRLVREQSLEGSHYNLHLLGTEQKAERELREMLRKTGFESPWKREFARIPGPQLSGCLEVPVNVMLPRVGGKALGSIVNFSYHGMLFEFVSTHVSMGEFIDQRIIFNIESNRGQVLRDVSARVKRIYDEMIVPGKLIRGLGVRFSPWRNEPQKVYEGFILDACNALNQGN